MPCPYSGPWEGGYMLRELRLFVTSGQTASVVPAAKCDTFFYAFLRLMAASTTKDTKAAAAQGSGTGFTLAITPMGLS